MADPERDRVKKVVGLDHAMLREVESWRARQKPVPDLSEAVRQLVAMGLASAPPAARRGKRSAKASELAGTMIDWLSDKSAPPEEQAKRKRRLIKGPSEFREMRDDLPKPKV